MKLYNMREEKTNDVRKQARGNYGEPKRTKFTKYDQIFQKILSTVL